MDILGTRSIDEELWLFKNVLDAFDPGWEIYILC
jgi:hypothetical protein